MKMLKTCGWCLYFKQHPTKTPRFIDGMFAGDGKCTKANLKGVFMAIGDSCGGYKKIGEKKNGKVR